MNEIKDTLHRSGPRPYQGGAGKPAPTGPEVNIEQQGAGGRHRAVFSAPAEGTSFSTISGPWRETRRGAMDDGDQFTASFAQGGWDAVQAKRASLRRAGFGDGALERPPLRHDALSQKYG